MAFEMKDATNEKIECDFRVEWFLQQILLLVEHEFGQHTVFISSFYPVTCTRSRQFPGYAPLHKTLQMGESYCSCACVHITLLSPQSPFVATKSSNTQSSRNSQRKRMERGTNPRPGKSDRTNYHRHISKFSERQSMACVRQLLCSYVRPDNKSAKCSLSVENQN